MVRVALRSDVPALVEMGMEFMSALYLGAIVGDRDKLAATLGVMIEGESTMIFVNDDGSGPNGVIGVALFEHPFSGELTASEAFWWVNPIHRGVGFGLMRQAERWAKDSGAKKMQMAAPTERVGEFYKKMGYMAVETAYQREL